MNCKGISIVKLYDYNNGTLDTRTESQVTSHLKGCQKCREFAITIKNIFIALEERFFVKRRAVYEEGVLDGRTREKANRARKVLRILKKQNQADAPAAILRA